MDTSLRNERPLIGAIRWDAWTGDRHGDVGIAVNRSLSPEKYHFRIPWFAEITGPNEVFIDGAKQEIVDKEIQFAKTYGIDYFAVLHYKGGMSFARKAYQNSLYRNGIKWCAIFESQRFVGDWAEWDDYIEQFKKPYYQKTADGRPVVYIFEADWPIKDSLETFRNKCEKAGVFQPYIIGMNFNIPKAAMIASELGLQAISLYTGGTPSAGCPYSAVMENDALLWNSMKKTGSQFVPQITSGWDKRPRYDNPTPWEPDYEDFKNQYAEQGTPEEIAQNIENAFNFNAENKNQTIFNSVIVYAWNENDEGGWICPTYFELRGSGKPLRLEAIREMKKRHRAAYDDIGGLSPAEKEAVENLAAAGVFGDIPDGKFKPREEISAKEFAAYLVSSAGYLMDTEVSGENLTRADAALFIYRFTQKIFDLPKS
ncbi:MAG: S-layer homology domain-containing protein [Oscillospiraceae bacterium]|nr:S-layer homology domain-containing protein [Oscillospiraceae bacterium]